MLAANFGLAAIAEDNHNWDEATKIYNQIKSSSVEQMYKDLADARLKLLPEIEQPVLVGSLTTKPADMAPLVMAPEFATRDSTRSHDDDGAGDTARQIALRRSTPFFNSLRQPVSDSV